MQFNEVLIAHNVQNEYEATTYNMSFLNFKSCGSNLISPAWISTDLNVEI